MVHAFLALLIMATPFSSAAKIHANETFKLPIITFDASSTVNFTLTVVDVDPEVSHNLLLLTQSESTIFLSVVGTSFVLGNMFRFLLLKQIWSDGGFLKPINIMTGNIFHSGIKTTNQPFRF